MLLDVTDKDKTGFSLENIVSEQTSHLGKSILLSSGVISHNSATSGDGVVINVTSTLHQG